MEPWRKEIEWFEEKLLRHRYSERFHLLAGNSDRLPDGQAGCWGMRLDAMWRLALSASDYGLEYDLLASAMHAGLSIKYCDPLVMGEKRTPSSFDPNDSVKKLKFITEKLGCDHRTVRDTLDNCEAEGWGAGELSRYATEVRRAFQLP